MDFGPDKTDGQLLLDYGVLDAEEPRVGGNKPMKACCMAWPTGLGMCVV